MELVCVYAIKLKILYCENKV